ncbi:MAG: hypothetical protein GXP29_13365 [Planctomycetes bacterium]|nr:hypothetical protein [Planctomycetota bacterium]
MNTKNPLLLIPLLLLLLAAAYATLNIVKIAESQQAIATWNECRSKLIAAGEPLTLAEIEARRPTVLPENNGALAIEALADELKFPNVDRSALIPVIHNASRGFDPFVGIPQGAIEPTRTFLREHESITDALLKLRGVTNGRLTILSYEFLGDNPLEFKIRSLRQWLVVGKLQQLFVLSRLVDGDINSAFEMACAQFGVAATMRNAPNSKIWGIRVSTIRGAVSSVECMLRAGELKHEQLDELTKLIDQQLESIFPKDAMRAERACMLEMLERLASNKIELSDLIDDEFLSTLGPFTQSDIREAQTSTAKIWTEIIEVAEDPVKSIAVAERLKEEESLLAMVVGMNDNLMQWWMQSPTVFALFTASSYAELGCARAALAAERYRLDNRRLPKSFEDLLPDYLDAAPLDPFNGKPLSFIATEEGIAIYSVGRNTTDNGGDFTITKGEYTLSDIGFRLVEDTKRGMVITPEAHNDDTP